MNEEANCRPEPCCTPTTQDPRPIDPNKAREIKILQQDFGYIVAVGCQTFAIENLDKLMKNLGAYLTNPSEYEKQWFSTRRLL